MSRFAIAVLMVLGPVLPTAADVAAQETEEESGGLNVSLVVLPYAGVADNPREMRLPVSPMAGMRAVAEIWLPVSAPVRIAAFVGGAGSILAVNTETSLEIDYLTTGVGGIRIDVPTQPYLIGFFGRAYPIANRTYDTETRKWLGGDSVVYGWGAGLSPVVGGSVFNIEGRYRRDQRMEAHLDESFEVLVGFPTRISW
ncbi:MAG: hypothetical protein OXU69_04850 [Gemmatimonadota bacterium]|nr:hypothetical protein [Gemmatimonadota bacterium]MDE2984016.1 hypothetical protein [Gemmatimonadota bacterium]